MKRTSIILLALLLIPAGALAARPLSSFSAERSLLATTSSPGNAYAAGASIVLTAPVSGDFSAVGGSIVSAAPVSGDELLLGGSINARAPVSGDFRAIGGNIFVEESVGGDLLAFGYSVEDSGRAKGSVFIVAANTTLSKGAVGPVTIYGNNVFLDGDFADDVTVAASGRVALGENAAIRGALRYESPEKAIIPASAIISGGVTYQSASYLPDVGTSRLLALMSLGLFVFARIFSALILAGLLAGLFPRLAEAIADRANRERPRTILLTMLLGFAILVATPVLLLVLALTFVGVGLALLLLVLYALLALLSFIYAGILLGTLGARRFGQRDTVLWRDGVFGMLMLSVIALVPVAGPLVVFCFSVFCAGTLLLLFFQTAFPREDTPEML